MMASTPSLSANTRASASVSRPSASVLITCVQHIERNSNKDSNNVNCGSNNGINQQKRCCGGTCSLPKQNHPNRKAAWTINTYLTGNHCSPYSNPKRGGGGTQTYEGQKKRDGISFLALTAFALFDPWPEEKKRFRSGSKKLRERDRNGEQLDFATLRSWTRRLRSDSQY